MLDVTKPHVLDHVTFSTWHYGMTYTCMCGPICTQCSNVSCSALFVAHMSQLSWASQSLAAKCLKTI